MPEKNPLDPKNSPTSVVLLSHGLNNSQACLDEMSQFLDKDQTLIRSLLLAGHEKNAPKTDPIPWDKIWVTQMVAAMEEAQALAQSHGIPLIFMGFSLSCVVFLNALKVSQIPFTRVIFFSPPLRMGRKFRLMEFLGRLGLRQVPSFNHPKYRAHPLLPITYYNALFSLIRSLEVADTQLLPKNGLIFFDRRDEMVSPSLIESWPRSHDLSWELAPIAVGSHRFLVFRHLIVVSSNVGEPCFALIQHGVREFIKSGKAFVGHAPVSPKEYRYLQSNSGCLQSKSKLHELSIYFPEKVNQRRLDQAIHQIQLAYPLLRANINGEFFQSRRNLRWLILSSGFAPSQQLQTPIHLMKEIGLRVIVSPDQTTVLLHIHPACLDRRDMEFFMEELREAYERAKASA